MVIRGAVKINDTPGSGTGDPLLTRDATSGEVGEVSSVSSGLSSTLTSGYIFVGNGSNVATGVAVTGDITVSNAGVVAIASGVIVNADINASAAIAVSKLAALTASRAVVTDASGFISAASVTSTELGYVSGVTSSIQTQLNAKQATITGGATTITSSNLTASRVLVSDGSGKVSVSSTTSTEIGYLSGVSSAIQTQINTKQSSIQFKDEGSNIGTAGAVTNVDFVGAGVTASHSSGTVTVTISGTSNGLPTGGTTGQVLIKNSATNYDASFDDLVLADISDVTPSAAQVNVLSTGYYDATSSVQNQIDNKLSKALTQNYLFRGNASNIATAFATGANGTVLTSVGGVPTWQTPGSGGTVTSVAASGGTTGLNFTGTPITVSGTLTLSGTLDEPHGGTGNTSFTTGDILYASASNTLSKLPIGSLGQVLSVSSGIPAWVQGSARAAVTVSSAELLTLGSSPVTIIPAPGANKYIVVHKICASYNYGTTAYNFANTESAYFYVGAFWTAFYIPYTTLNLTTDVNGTLLPYQNFFLEVPTNTALTLKTYDGGNPSTGDGNWDIVVYYTIEDVNT